MLSLWKIAHVCCKLRNFLGFINACVHFLYKVIFFLHIDQRTLTILSLLMGLFRYQTQQENSKTTFLVKTMFCTMIFLFFCSICWHSTIPKLLCEPIKSLVCDYLKLFVRKFRFEQYVEYIFVNFVMHIVWFAFIHELCSQQFVVTLGTEEMKS